MDRSLQLAYDINKYTMGKRTKAKPIQICFQFVKASKESQLKCLLPVQKSLLINDDTCEEGEQLVYEGVLKLLEKFLASQEIKREVKIWYLDVETDEKCEIREGFRLEYEVIRQKYQSTLVILVQTKIEYYWQKLQRIVEELDELFKEFEDVKKRM